MIEKYFNNFNLKPGIPLPIKRILARKTDEFDTGSRLVTTLWGIERFLVYTNVKKFHYFYDFGDQWDHLISVGTVEDLKIGEIYPKLLVANGICPSDDIGGIRHYCWALEIINDPNDENHEDTIDWFDNDFDPYIDVFPTLVKKVEEFAQHYQKKSLMSEKENVDQIKRHFEKK